MTVQTLPDLARAWGANPEALKTFVRRHGRDLAGLGQRVGNSRAYTPAEAAQIREAFERRRKLVRAACGGSELS